MALMNPSINIGGSSADTMVEDRRKVITALRDAMDAMLALQPHGRDYVGRDQQFSLDRAFHRNRQQALLDMHDEIMAEALAIQESGHGN